MKARASHILVDTEKECLDMKDKIQNYEQFVSFAKQVSKCPSGSRGGDLGVFQPKQMVPEFDQVVFSADLNTVQGPVKTQFGYHLIWIAERG